MSEIEGGQDQHCLDYGARLARTSGPASPILTIEAIGQRGFIQRAGRSAAWPDGGRDRGRGAPDAPEPAPALVTELLLLGPFATRQAERAVGAHDRLRLDLLGDSTRFEPGMTVWLDR